MKKGKRSLFLTGALVLALLITGGIFASAWSFSNSGQDSVTWGSDYAVVSANTTNIDAILPATVYGGTWGDVAAKDPIFTITPTSGYTGDVWVTVYIANTDDLSQKLEHLNIEVKSTYTAESDPLTQVLTLDNGKVAFPMSGYATNAITVSTTGGTLYAYADFAGSGTMDLYCEVKPRGISS